MKGPSNLQSAADLIFMEKKAPQTPTTLNGTKSKKTNNLKEESDSKAPTTSLKNDVSKSNGDKKVDSKKVEHKKETKVVEQVKEEPKFNLVRPSKNSAPAPVETPSRPTPKPVLTAQEQFPRLGASASKISANFVPVKSASNQSGSSWNGKAPVVAVQTVQPSGRGAPPPGFQNPAPVKKPAPPPGFKAPVMSYQEPSNFAPRNQQLLSTIM